MASAAPWHVSVALWAPFYLSHHTIRLSVALGGRFPLKGRALRMGWLSWLPLSSSQLWSSSRKLSTRRATRTRLSSVWMWQPPSSTVMANTTWTSSPPMTQAATFPQMSWATSTKALCVIIQVSCCAWQQGVSTSVAYVTGASPLSSWCREGGSFDSCIFCCHCSGLHWGSLWPRWLGGLVQVHGQRGDSDSGRRPDGDKPQAHRASCWREGLQLPPAQSQPDWICHGGHPSVSPARYPCCPVKALVTNRSRVSRCPLDE